MNAYIEKAEILTEALPFIQQFRGETVVVKFGGSIMENEVGVRNILQDIAFMECVGMHPVVVHGGGKSISKALRSEDIHSEFLHGLRITDSNSIKVVERVLNNEVNPHMVDILREFDGKARGIHGEDIFLAEKMTGRDSSTNESCDWGFVGSINSVDVEPIDAYMKSEIVPVITPLAPTGSEGRLIIPKNGDSFVLAKAFTNSEGIFLFDKSEGIGELISGNSSSIKFLGKGLALLTNMNCALCVSISGQ